MGAREAVLMKYATEPKYCLDYNVDQHTIFSVIWLKKYLH